MIFLEFPETKKLFKIFNKYKIEARFVGGCVRDALSNCKVINCKIIDFDIAINCNIHKVCEILEQNGIKVIRTGIKYSSITVIINDKKFEITSLRQDVDCDGRWCQIENTDSFEQDAKRRDFTINAIYCDQNGQIFDYCNGINDLKNHNIKFIGDTKQRIQEDYLRILRYFRFCSKYQDYSNKYSKIILEESNNIHKFSSQRIQNELFKILEISDIKILQNMVNTNILKNVNLKDYAILLKLLSNKLQSNQLQSNQLQNNKSQSNKLQSDKSQSTQYDENLALKLYILFQNEIQMHFSQTRLPQMCVLQIYLLPKRIKKKIKLYKQFEPESLLYIAYKVPDIQNDMIIIQYIKQGISNTSISNTSINKTHKIPLATPYNCKFPKFLLSFHDLPAGIKYASRKLNLCEKWWVYKNFQPSKEECLEYILQI